MVRRFVLVPMFGTSTIYTSTEFGTSAISTSTEMGTSINCTGSELDCINTVGTSNIYTSWQHTPEITSMIYTSTHFGTSTIYTSTHFGTSTIYTSTDFGYYYAVQ